MGLRRRRQHPEGDDRRQNVPRFHVRGAFFVGERESMPQYGRVLSAYCPVGRPRRQGLTDPAPRGSPPPETAMPAVTVDSAAPLFVILNAGSGRQGAAETRATVERALTGAGRAHEIAVVTDPLQLPEIAREAVLAARADGGVVVAAGGDGTINAVAQAVLGSGCAFGVLPQGTFNYFGRTHGIPADTGAATRVLSTRRRSRSRSASSTTASFSSTRASACTRSCSRTARRTSAQFGRSRLVAFACRADARCSARHRKLRLHSSRRHRLDRAHADAVRRQQPAAAGADWDRARPARSTRPPGRRSRCARSARSACCGCCCAARGPAGRRRQRRQLRVSAAHGAPGAWRARKPMKVATDGEVAWLEPPIEFRVSPRAALADRTGDAGRPRPHGETR